MVLEELMPAAASTGRPRRHSYREIINTIFYVLSNGTKWRAMPHDLPPWKTVYGYFRKWRKTGQWQTWHTTLRRRLRIKLGRKAEVSAAVLDSQSIRTAEGGEAEVLTYTNTVWDVSDIFLLTLQDCCLRSWLRVQTGKTERVLKSF